MLYILHDNTEWLDGLIKELHKQEVPYTLWFLDDASRQQTIDFTQEPPEGVYFNRISCSAHTRGHEYSVNFSRQVLQWLETYGRSIIHGTQAFSIETSKAYQDILLNHAGIQTPPTWTCTYKESILKASEEHNEFPVILKDNIGGSGSGVFKINDHNHLLLHLKSALAFQSPDRITILQKYIDNPTDKIYRVEFVNFQHVYTLEVIVGHSFNLCPAQSCQLENCPLKRKKVHNKDGEVVHKFNIRDNITPPALIEQYTAFAKAYNLRVVAFEYTQDKEGQFYTYDVNLNTNYNLDAESRWGKPNWANQCLVEYFKLCMPSITEKFIEE